MKNKIHCLSLVAIMLISLNGNSQTILSGTYEGTTYALTKALSPYVVTDSAIFNCDYFAIDPGVIIIFKYHQDPEKKSYMRINGALDVISTINSEPIIFTSERDNQPYDLNGDSTASRPVAGDWGYVYFDQPGPDNHLPLFNAQFRFGGGKKFNNEADPEMYPMIIVSDYNSKVNTNRKLSLSNCRISNSAGVGIMGGMVRLSEVQISNCVYGIRGFTSDVEISNCEIRDNKKYPVIITDPLIKRDGGDDFNAVIDLIYNNAIYHNGLDVIALEGHIRCAYDVNSSAPLIRSDLPEVQVPYLIIGDLYIDSLQFNISKGTLIKFLPGSSTGKPLNIYFIHSATLRIMGTRDDKVIFTSLYDYKYDKFPPANQDLQPNAGDWGIISCENPEIMHTVFRYGGKYVNTITGNIVSDSSSVIHIRRADPGKCRVDSSIFINLFANGIFVGDSAVISGQTNINGNSFLLNQDSYGIITANKILLIDSMVNGRNNFWNGKLGPFHPDLNSTGNGCRVGNYIDFSNFESTSQDANNLLKSVIRGVVKNDQGELVKNAIVKLESKNPKPTYTDILGQFYLNELSPGDGYKLVVMAKSHHGTIIEPLNIPEDTSLNLNIVLEKYTIDYGFDTTNFNINPVVSTVSVGGTAHRYYKIVDVKTQEPVYGVDVLVSDVDTFYTNSKGIVDIAIPASIIGKANSSKSFYIQRVGLETLDFPKDSRITFEVQVKPYSYHKVWSGNTFFTVGVAGFEGKKLNGAALDLDIKNNGTTENADSIILVRQSQTGFGYSLGASAKATLGPAEAGAEAGIGVNMNVLLEDDFKFNNTNTSGSLALSKFIVLADGALPYMDAPLIRYFAVALEKRMTEIDAAALSNNIGMNIHAFASADAGLDLDIGSENSPLGAALKGSASATGDITYMAKVHSHKNPITNQYPTDLTFDDIAEVSAKAEAGIGFDLSKLFGNQEKNPDTQNGENHVKVKKVNSNLPFPVPDEDLKLDLATAHISGGVKFGTHFGTTRFVPSPYCSIGFMYGYKYSYGAEAILLGDAGKSQNREFRYNFDFYDNKVLEMVKQSTDLAKSMLSPDSLINLNISDLTTGKVFNGPMNKISDLQTRNSFTIAPIPYQKTITDQVGEGGFNIIIDVGVAVVRAKFGAGFNYKVKNNYQKESGLFYKWQLYPLESYDFLENDESYKAKPTIQDIVNTSASYLVDQVKQKLVPPIFRKVHVWSRFFKSANASQYIPIGPPSRNSSISFSDSSGFASIEGIDSLNVIYWDWYGTGEDTISLKKTISPQVINLLEYVKKSAIAAHKLDYGIGGFYQFEPYNTSVGDNAVQVTINYYDQELTVMLPDSSITNIDENNLRMYKEDKENNRWVYIGGTVDTLNNTVTARIDSFGTFTLAPFIPSGELKLSASPDTICLETTHTTTITSEPIYYNTDQIVAHGELFTLKASRGTFTGTDADTISPGFQVASSGGIIQINYETNNLSGNVYILAESVKGDASGKIEIVVSDTVSPVQPVLKSAELNEENVSLLWKKNKEQDIVKYMVQYDTTSGGPYHGTASVFGDPSPVDAGLDSTFTISGLLPHKTYYFIVNAVDRSGNISPNSNELSIFTEFNHTPVFYYKIIHAKPDLPKGTVIDTLKATDVDPGQQFTFYFSDKNTEDAFALDPTTGVLTVNNADRLNYFVTRKDTFLLYAGVKDNAVNSASDEGEIMVVLDIATWKPEYAPAQNTKLEIYPNPAKDYITLKLGESVFSEDVSVNIYNISGMNCYSRILHRPEKNELKIPVSFLEKGYYMIELKTENHKRMASFIVIK